MQQATVAIGSKQWSVDVAVTPAELTQGLSGIASIPANTGMLFDLGDNQASIIINTSQMLFNLDIIFINTTLGVVGILSGVGPTDSVSFSMDVGARYFLEVNTGEASSIQLGDSVQISGNGLTTGIDISSIMSMMIMLVVVVMMMKMVGKQTSPVERHSIHGPERQELVDQYGSWAVGRAESVCPEDDVACVRKEAARLLGAHRRGYSY